MASHDVILAVVRQALDECDAPRTTVAALTRTALRVATLRNDPVQAAIFRMETADLSTPAAGRKSGRIIVEELAAFMPFNEANVLMHAASERRYARRSLPGQEALCGGKARIWGGSVSQLENEVDSTADKISELRTDAAIGVQGGQLYLDNERIQLELRGHLSGLQAILDRTKTFIHEYLVESEAELDHGQTYASVFERTQRYVDSTLESIQPETGKELISAGERIIDGRPAALAQAMTSCRRVLKQTADIVYPSHAEPIVGADGRTRQLQDKNYINRILQFAIDASTSSTQQEVFQANLESLGRRLGALNGLNSKGVHSTVSPNEAEGSYNLTYLIVAEILHLRDDIPRKE